MRATFDGQPYRGSVQRMGGRPIIAPREIRARIARSIGDEVEVTLEFDREVRRVVVPGDLAAALAGDPVARSAFEARSYSHQREHVGYVDEAKEPETRARRISATLEILCG